MNMMKGFEQRKEERKKVFVKKVIVVNNSKTEIKLDGWIEDISLTGAKIKVIEKFRNRGLKTPPIAIKDSMVIFEYKGEEKKGKIVHISLPSESAKAKYLHVKFI